MILMFVHPCWHFLDSARLLRRPPLFLAYIQGRQFSSYFSVLMFETVIFESNSWAVLLTLVVRLFNLFDLVQADVLVDHPVVWRRGAQDLLVWRFLGDQFQPWLIDAAVVDGHATREGLPRLRKKAKICVTTGGWIIELWTTYAHWGLGLHSAELVWGGLLAFPAIEAQGTHLLSLAHHREQLRKLVRD